MEYIVVLISGLSSKIISIKIKKENNIFFVSNLLLFSFNNMQLINPFNSASFNSLCLYLSIKKTMIKTLIHSTY